MNKQIRLIATFKVLVFIFAALVFPLAQAETVVIVHKDNSMSNISKSELGRIFLGKSSEFGNGSAATPVNQVLASEVRKDFDSNMLKRSESQIKSYWSKMMFSGEGTPPEEVNGDLDVLKKVMGETSAIGYVDSSAVNDGVKVLSVD